MIFVTVGTHEQPFNRLIEFIDNLKKERIITEEVIIQTGYSTYIPQYCKSRELFTYKEMVQNVANARIVITHGGPASFIMPLQIGKTPVVVPRQHVFDEHVNNHQVDFVREVVIRKKNIIVVDKIEDLKNILLNYGTIIAAMSTGIENNNIAFNTEFEKLVEMLFQNNQ